MPNYYLGLDQGTTGTTAIVFDGRMTPLATCQLEHAQSFPSPGLVEQDPEELWQNCRQAAETALAKAGLSAADLSAIGLANQGETVVLWDTVTGLPVYPAIVWQDRRTAKAADELNERYGAQIREKTGLIADPYFSATKIRWVLDNVPGAREKAAEGRLAAGTLDAWLIWKMTHGRVFATDCSTASRTMLFNIRTGDWDPEILQWLDIPRGILPEVRGSAGHFGDTDPLDFFGAAVPIAGSATDQQAALFGQGCFTPGDVKTTYGTGCFMLMNTGTRPVLSEHGLLTTVAWRLPEEEMRFALDAGVYTAGAAIRWLKQLGLIESAAQTDAMAAGLPDNGGVWFVPAFSGLAAPHWDPYARGTLLGLTDGTSKEQIVRAALESIAYQVKDNLDVLEKDSGIRIRSMRVDGGLTANAFLMQFQADILGIPVDVPEITETTALGAASLAACGIGACRDAGLSGAAIRKRYVPNMPRETREKLLHGWHRAVERAKHWAEE